MKNREKKLHEKAVELPQKEEHLGRGYLEKILRAEFWSKLHNLYTIWFIITFAITTKIRGSCTKHSPLKLTKILKLGFFPICVTIPHLNISLYMFLFS